VYFLPKKFTSFPPLTEANADGLLAIGGNLNVESLLLAYKSGIFPWYSESEPIMWWSPDPRFVILPGELTISKSMHKIIRNEVFEIKFNHSFEKVIANCAKVKRAGQRGTWITTAIQAAYIKLHKKGFAISGEAWQNGELVGGFYGILIENSFFGESMFSLVDNASKVAFLTYAEKFFKEGGKIIDCQLYTKHLQSLGAKMIERNLYLELINQKK
jgi:leucyl/phenylalanyl-tRNA---protein transferase